MNRSIAVVVALLGLGIALPAGNAVPGQTPKGHFAGTRTLISWDKMKPDGTMIPPLAGINSVGVVMFDSNWHLSFQPTAATSSTDPQSDRSIEVAQRKCPNGRC
jgi:hypothetical protein